MAKDKSMTEGVIDNQALATPDKEVSLQKENVSDKELNFRRLEAQRDQEKEARMRAEMQTDMLRKEFETLKTMMKPKEKDPLDDIQDLSELEPRQLKEILSRRDTLVRKEAEESALRRFEERQKELKRTNFRDVLRDKYLDFDEVMNQDVITSIQEQEPDAIDAISSIEDPYVRCEKAYKFIKNKRASNPQEPGKTIQDTIQENLRNPYLIPGSSGSPSAVDFDVRSPTAKKAAYAKLKAAQRQPLGGGHPSFRR